MDCKAADLGFCDACLNHSLATVVARGADVVATVNLSRGGLNGRGGIGEKVVRPMHTAL
jgi:hypothetical protein